MKKNKFNEYRILPYFIKIFMSAKIAVAILIITSMATMADDLNSSKLQNTGEVLSQQQKLVSGKVNDSTGSPLPGVSVVLKGTTNGAITDTDGKFSLANVPGNGVLVFSFVGMKGQEVPVSGKETINVTLVEETIGLEEVVAVGYGAISKKVITGSIQEVKAATLKDVPVTSVEQGLQGKLAGVQINQISGKLGGSTQMRIRGQASLTAGAQPLYVVDGFPIDGDLRTINPNEIESVSILKDAASTSIYGSRASNGVVLVTTRTAKMGTQIAFSAYYGTQHVPQYVRPDMMNAKEFAAFKVQYYEDHGATTPAAGLDFIRYMNFKNYDFSEANGGEEGTNWYDLMLRTAPMQNYDLTLSTKKDNISATTTLGIMKQDGVVVNSRYQRFSFRSNVEYKITNKLKAGLNIAPTFIKNSGPTTDGLLYGGSIITNSLNMFPTSKAYNADGNLTTYVNDFVTTGGFNVGNWLHTAQRMTNATQTLSGLTNTYLTYEPISGLTLKSTLNLQVNYSNTKVIKPTDVATTSFFASIPNLSTGTFTDLNTKVWLWENTANYKKSIGDHNFEGLLGYSSQDYRFETKTIGLSDFADDRIPTLASAKTVTSRTNDIQSWSMVSLISRLNYNYKNRYLITASMRRDGSSRFGADKRWANFPSISAGWVISDENFFPKTNFLNFMKLRGGYGVVGNNNIGNYASYAAVATNTPAIFNNTIYAGSGLTSMENRQLTWEQNQEYDLGLDFGFLKDRITLSYDFYTKNTKSLLYSIAIPTESGFGSYLGNLGELKFWGHEFVLNTKNFVGKFKWNTSFNISFTGNKVVSLDQVDRIYSGAFGSSTITKVGSRIGLFYGLDLLGFYESATDLASSPHLSDSSVGNAKFRDVNGDGKITYGGDSDDRTVIGDPTPIFVFGLSNDFTYKNFDMAITMSGSYGNDLFKFFEQQNTNLDGVYNLYKAVGNHWRPGIAPGTAKYGATTGSTYHERDYWSTRFVEDGSYLTIKNVTLGYTLPVNKIRYVKSLRIYGSVQQLYTFTKYSGVNPEVSTDINGGSASSLNLGIDWGSYPVPRTFTFGVNINL